MPANEFGITADQEQRLKRLQWPQLVKLIDLLGLDCGLFSQFSPPAQHLLSFQDAAMVAETRPATVELALQRAAAVAKIKTPAGSGSGFIVAGNLLVTNSHVLPDLTPIRVALDPDASFLNWPASGHDLTIVALAEPAADRWLEIPLVPVMVKKTNVFVSSSTPAATKNTSASTTIW